MLVRLSEDVQSSLQLHSRQLSSHSIQHPASSPGGKFGSSAAEASACAASPSSAASGLNRDVAFSVDGSSIADEVRSSQSRINMSLQGASDASREFSRPSTFGEAAGAGGGHRQGPELAAQLMNSHRAAAPAATAASSSRHRILGEIEQLMRALKSGGGGA